MESESNNDFQQLYDRMAKVRQTVRSDTSDEVGNELLHVRLELGALGLGRHA